MSMMNKEWHAAHVMPPNPTKDQRIAWHAEHATECGCRPVPENLLADVKALRKKKSRLSN